MLPLRQGRDDFVRRTCVRAQAIGIDAHDDACAGCRRTAAAPRRRAASRTSGGRGSAPDPESRRAHGSRSRRPGSRPARCRASKRMTNGGTVPGRHEGPRAVDVADGLGHRLAHVGAGWKKSFMSAAPWIDLRFDVLDAGDVEEVVLVVVGDEPFHLRRVHAAVRLGDVDHRRRRGPGRCRSSCAARRAATSARHPRSR